MVADASDREMITENDNGRIGSNRIELDRMEWNGMEWNGMLNMFEICTIDLKCERVARAAELSSDGVMKVNEVE